MTDPKVLELVQRADRWTVRKTGKGLAEVQKAILEQALEGQRLKDIQVSGYSPSTVKQEIAPKLWKLLSEVTEQQVRIRTVRLVLEKLPEQIPTQSSFMSENRSRDRSGTITPELELPGGQVPLDSPFYVKRPAVESDAYKEISKPGSLIRIKAPKQMGKTSLLGRLLHQAEQQGSRSVVLNFQDSAESRVFANLDVFLQWFCATVTNALRLPIELDSHWSEFLSSKTNCTNYFEEYLLPAIGAPLALGLDAVDEIFPHEKVAEDFFPLLRAWHENGKQSEIWKNFRQVIVHGTEVYIPLSNDQSPFNVGLPVELSEFDATQVQDLATRHGINFTSTAIEQLMSMVGGHPHLVRLALYKIARQDITLDRILNDAPLATGIYADYLRSHLWHLEQYPELAKALKQVVEADAPVELKSALAFKLNSMGLVHRQGDYVTVRNNLYRQYFRDRLESLVLDTQTPEQSRLSFPELAGESDLGENVLAAIVFTDVKDSTQKQQKNQKSTLAAIRRDQQLMTQLCEQFEGRAIKSVGDGLLMYFVSAVQAVKCTQAIQYTLAVAAPEQFEDEDDLVESQAEVILQHRIGIHLADVYFNGIDVVGDGVNIASRLQAEAEPGGICISWIVYEAVKTHLQLNVIHIEQRSLKGISDPMLLYQIAP